MSAVDAAVVVPVSYNKRDLILYALGIGERDLKYIYEKHPDFAAFPTYPVVLGFKGASGDIVEFPSIPMKASASAAKISSKGPVLDGERHIEIHRPLPSGGAEMKLYTRVVGVHPKRSGTLVENAAQIKDSEGNLYCTITTGMFHVGVKEAKKFGNSHSRSSEIPSREPDEVVEQKTNRSQAEIYRLSGDYNPLHVDPQAAKKFKFPAPILHGLCTLGHSARHVLATFGNNQASKMKSLSVRFSSPVFPGETLVTRMWKGRVNPADGTFQVVFETKVKERGKIVMSRCQMTLYSDVRSSL